MTGVLGPHSNAHGPNEFLDIEYCKKVVVCISKILAAHSYRERSPDRTFNTNLSLDSANLRVAGALEDKLSQTKKYQADGKCYTGVDLRSS